LPFPTRSLQRLSVAPPEGPPVELLPLSPAVAEESHAPVASLGPYLFVKTLRVARPCADPPGYDALFSVFSLGPSVEKIPLDALGPPSGLDAARALLPGPAPRLTLSAPALSPEGLRWSEQYTEPSSWAEARGGWGSETRSVRVPAPAPSRLADATWLPEPALRFLQKHPDFEAAGVSVWSR